MGKRIPLKKFIKNFDDCKKVFAMSLEMPKEFADMNLVVREIHMDNIQYNENGQVIAGDIEAFVEAIDETKPIPDFEE